MPDVRCFGCRMITGKVSQPGGILYENDYWMVRSKSHPVFVRGNLFLFLKRHCEELADLTKEEAASLGPTIQRTCKAIEIVLQPERIYVASYGEGVRHIHFHITPRTASLPSGNGVLFLYQRWRALLYHVGMKRVAESEEDTLQTTVLIRAQLESLFLDEDLSFH